MAWKKLYIKKEPDMSNNFSPIIIIGKSGAGKDTTAKELEKSFGFTRVVEYTTRTKRDYEIDGTDYNFITEEEFKKMDENDEFISSSSFKRIQDGAETTVYYGIKRSDIKRGCVIATNPYNMKNIKSEIKSVKVVYLYVPDVFRLKRLKDRGDDINEIKRRSESDDKDFTDEVTEMANIIVFNGRITSSGGRNKQPKIVAREIIDRLRERK